MSEALPQGWIYTVLGDVSTHPQYGWTCSSINNGTLKLLRTTDISNGKINWATVPFCAKKPDNDEKYLLKDNDILVSRAGSVGISYRITKNDLFHRTVFASYLIRFCPFIPASFVEHYFKSHNYWQFISDSQLGIAVPNVNATKLSELPFPLPPLNEQKRIVTKLDKIMPRIDAVKERLDKVPSIIKRFRQSVLTAAVTGKLTEKWRAEHPDVESAEVLLKNINKTKNQLHRQKKITKPKPVSAIGDDIKFEIPDSWLWCRLAQISFQMSTGPFGTMLHKSDYISKGIPVINPTNIKNSTIIPYEKMMISQDTLERLNRYKLDVNDVIIARRGDLSKCGIVTDMEKGWLCGTGSFFLKVGIEPIFFRLFYISDYCQAELNEDSIGSTMQNLNQKVLSNTPFPLPPLEEQKEIVRQVDKLFAFANKLGSHYQKAKARVDKLSQSVLAKAFRGELVITEAELAEKEGRDFESAEKLLERILEEKAKLVGSRQRIVGGMRTARGSTGKKKSPGGRKNEKD